MILCSYSLKLACLLCDSSPVLICQFPNVYVYHFFFQRATISMILKQFYQIVNTVMTSQFNHYMDYCYAELALPQYPGPITGMPPFAREGLCFCGQKSKRNGGEARNQETSQTIGFQPGASDLVCSVLCFLNWSRKIQSSKQPWFSPVLKTSWTEELDISLREDEDHLRCSITFQT